MFSLYSKTFISRTFMSLFLVQLLQMQKEIGKYSAEVGDHDDRIHSMSQHLKNVRQELTHNLVSLFGCLTFARQATLGKPTAQITLLL